MNAEIITIGYELITGHTVDTNAAFIAQHLTEAGIDVKYLTSVGDTMEDIEASIRVGLNRAEIVITTGGLGPTDDDITKKGIVKVFKRNLIYNEEVLQSIKERYTRRGIEMPAISQNQALLPQGANFFTNKNGTAVGICITEKGKIFIALPGVPKEMEQILTDEVMPYLNHLKTNRKTKIITLHTTGITESKLSELIKSDLKLPPSTRLSYLPSFRGVDLRIHSSGDTEEIALENSMKLKNYLESICGKYIYGQDDDSLESVIGQLLKDNDKTICVAESCTGGQLGMILTSVPGSSEYFQGGVIAYSNEVKIEKLGVTEDIINQYGAVSEECAKAMATGARNKFESSFALSITGIAGPDGVTDEKAVGTTYIGLSSVHTTIARKFIFSSDRHTNRSRAVYAALELLRREILDIK